MTRRYRHRSRIARRIRRWWRRAARRDRRGVLIAVVIGLLAAAAAHAAKGSPQAPGPATAAAAPATRSYTPQTWAAAFLTAIPEPQTACNLAAIEGWEQAEGGAWANQAAYNPLNTARPEPGSYAINSDGVQSYPNWAEGLQANVAAITNGLYGGILAALRAGNNAQAVADAVAASPWGTSWFPASC
jgi:hypothetical protein